MTDFVQTTLFGPKDSLPSGDPEKVILGADFDVEFGNIATSIATKADDADLTATNDSITALEGTQIIAGAGLSGGGDLAADRTIDLDIFSLPPLSPSNTAMVPIFSGGSMGRASAVDVIDAAFVNPVQKVTKTATQVVSDAGVFVDDTELSGEAIFERDAWNSFEAFLVLTSDTGTDLEIRIRASSGTTAFGRAIVTVASATAMSGVPNTQVQGDSTFFAELGFTNPSVPFMIGVGDNTLVHIVGTVQQSGGTTDPRLEISYSPVANNPVNISPGSWVQVTRDTVS